MATNFSIIRDGSFFRAVIDGARSSLFTSASQAGLYIERRLGADAHRAAAATFLAVSA